MVKHDNKWGTVCDDDFDSTDAQAACNTLGFSGGSYSSTNPGFSESTVPIWMDEVNCDSNYRVRVRRQYYGSSRSSSDYSFSPTTPTTTAIPTTIASDSSSEESSLTNFLECGHNGWGDEDCSHSEDILLTCT